VLLLDDNNIIYFVIEQDRRLVLLSDDRRLKNKSSRGVIGRQINWTVGKDPVLQVIGTDHKDLFAETNTIETRRTTLSRVGTGQRNRRLVLVSDDRRLKNKLSRVVIGRSNIKEQAVSWCFSGSYTIEEKNRRLVLLSDDRRLKSELYRGVIGQQQYYRRI